MFQSAAPTRSSRSIWMIVSVVAVVAWTGAADSQEAALSFDGVDDIASIPSTNQWPISTSTLTIELWVRPSDVPASSITGVFWGESSSTGFGMPSNNTSMAFTVSTANTNSAYAPAGSLAAGRWDHFAGTWDGTTIRIYHDGVLVDEVIHGQPGSVLVRTDYVIGARSSSQSRYTGIVDEIRIWNAVRSESEISKWKDRPLTGSEPDLIAYWRLNEGGGQDILDSSPSTADGVLGLTGAVEPEDPDWTTDVAPLAFFFDGFETGNTGAWSTTSP